ncbi:hypothetical protein GVN15_21185 [Pseudomonas putida]|nr:hypothetical protein [Pseudomonas putida]
MRLQERAFNGEWYENALRALPELPPEMGLAAIANGLYARSEPALKLWAFGLLGFWVVRFHIK